MRTTTLLTLTSSLAIAIATLGSAPVLAERPSGPRQIAEWINPDDIALDPVLLNTEKLDEIGVDNLLGQNRGRVGKIQAQTKKAGSSASALEIYYEERLDTPVAQFGYDLFDARKNDKGLRHSSGGAIQDSYILGQGDELSILIRGQENITRKVPVSIDGQLVIEDLAPVSAAGRTIKSVREELQSMLGDYYNTDVHLSLSKTKKISVTVSGNIADPGEISLSSFDTITDALSKAGGVLKTGTLRQIKLIRGQSNTVVDLYGVLIYGSGTSDLSLRDGDMIQVGPIGPTVAIAGAVKRPAIYEILPNRQSLSDNPDRTSQLLSLSDLMMFSGGAIAPGNLRYIRSSADQSGRDNISEVDDTALKIFHDGDILNVHKGKEKRSDSIELLGHTRADGIYALADTPSLSSLLSSDIILGPEIYPLIGIIERWNAHQLSKELIAFSPRKVVAGEADARLMESDRILLFSRQDIAALGTPEQQDGQTALKLASLDTSTKFDEDGSQPQKLKSNLKNFLLEHSVFIRGSIRDSGSYPVASGTTLDALLSIAGGPSLEASLGNIEITQPLAEHPLQRTNIDLRHTPASTISLHPGDTIRINRKFQRVEDRHVLLVGEVRNPGTYDLLPGDTLGKLIERAGGITEQSYPDGTIFSRKSERLREEQRFKSNARDLELKLTAALAQEDDNKKPDAEEITLAKSLIADLKNAEALGRLTVEADPSMLLTHPEMDILLETGDRIYIPKRPLTVRVAGEVLSPASLQFLTGKKPRTYIDEAGGFTYNADQDRSFVVYPDGSAQPLSVSAWNHSATMIPPGSTIIVPRDPKPLGFMDGAKDLSQILANLATTAIFADDIANDH